MRKRMLVMMAVAICVLLTFSVALAASYDGAIWTGNPTAFGTGYYCTAAQNRSQGDVSTHWARAKTWKTSELPPIDVTADGNDRAVASTDKTKPYKGWGAYGEPGWSTDGSFNSDAWD